MAPRFAAGLGVALFVAVFLPNAPAAEQETEVQRQLRAYYGDHELRPPWRKAVDQLSAEDTKARAEAARYLVALLTQALANERAATPAEDFTPRQRRYSQHSAYWIHWEIAQEIAKRPGSPAALPVFRWYLDNAPDPSQQADVFDGVDKLEGKEVDDFRISLLGPAHRNAAVVVAALRQLGKRKAPVPADKLLPLCQHYRATIREEARKLNAQQKGAAPGPFDPVAAIKSEAISKLMERIGKSLVEPAPGDAKWVHITNEEFNGRNRQHAGLDGGWLVNDDAMADSFVVLSASGWKETFSKSPKEVAGATVSGESSFVEEKIEKALAQLLDHRNAYRQQEQEKLDRGVCRPYDVDFVHLDEVLVGEWLYRCKRYDLAARIILPAIDGDYLDDYMVDVVRHSLSQNYSYQMLSAFAGGRDYGATLKLAKLVRDRFPGTEFHKYAVGLADQLPKRRDDFEQVKLPIATEWTKVKAKLSRAEQIDYLCRRLRLLNCFQWSQPGGVSYAETQYAEARGMERDAAGGGHGGKTEVINPLVELAGEFEGEVDPGATISGGLGLTAPDIPALAPHLREDWYMPTISFFRSFATGRHLHSVRPLLASIINNLAKRKLVDVEKFAKLTDAERGQEIERIIQWAKENANKPVIDLHREAVRDAIKDGVPWRQVAPNLDALIKAQSPEALPALLHYLDEKATYNYDKRGILRNCRRLDAKATKEQAHRCLASKDIGVQAQAATTLLKTGETKEALTALLKVVTSATRTDTGGVEISEYIFFSDDFQDMMAELLAFAPKDPLVISLARIQEPTKGQLQSLKKWLTERISAATKSKEKE
jgi:hypothetical protein